MDNKVRRDRYKESSHWLHHVAQRIIKDIGTTPIIDMRIASEHEGFGQASIQVSFTVDVPLEYIDPTQALSDEQ